MKKLIFVPLIFFTSTLFAIDVKIGGVIISSASGNVAATSVTSTQGMTASSFTSTSGGYICPDGTVMTSTTPFSGGGSITNNYNTYTVYAPTAPINSEFAINISSNLNVNDIIGTGNAQFSGRTHGFGIMNELLGDFVFSGGSFNSLFLHDYSIGENNTATAPFGFIFGWDDIASENQTYVFAGASDATADHSMTIGFGIDASNHLINNIPNSIMLGVRETSGTMLIQKSTVTISGLLASTNLNIGGTPSLDGYGLAVKSQSLFENTVYIRGGDLLLGASNFLSISRNTNNYSDMDFITKDGSTSTFRNVSDNTDFLHYIKGKLKVDGMIDGSISKYDNFLSTSETNTQTKLDGKLNISSGTTITNLLAGKLNVSSGTYIEGLLLSSPTWQVKGALQTGDYLNDIKVSSSIYSTTAGTANALKSATNYLNDVKVSSAIYATNANANSMTTGNYLNDVKVSSAMYATTAGTLPSGTYTLIATTANYVANVGWTTYIPITSTSTWLTNISTQPVSRIVDKAFTISTVTFAVNGGTSASVRVFIRTANQTFNTAGTAILSASVSVTSTNMSGGTLSNTSVPSGSGIVLVVDSIVGAVKQILVNIQGTR